MRYTTHNAALYAIALGWPAGNDLHPTDEKQSVGTSELRLHSLYRGNPYLPGEVCSVRLLGAEGDLKWKVENDGLHIQLPAREPDEPAFTFRILTRRADGKGCGS